MADQEIIETSETRATEAEKIETPAILADEFEYISLLGEGANGKTWLARNLETNQKVAIKALKLSQVDNNKSFELFQREGELLASVHIKGVPQFYKNVVSPDGNDCFIVQEYVSAPSIQSYLKPELGEDEVGLEKEIPNRIFTEREVISLFKPVCKILMALHKMYTPPIVHRDIKPSNIMCEMPENAADIRLNPFLIDFGAVANPQNKSSSSTIAGTYGYMAPEQMLGNCSVQCDYYALGATALHMLTGVPPYEIDSDVFRLKYNEALDKHAPQTSQNMRKFIGNLLEPEPAKRVKDIDEVIRQLDNIDCGRDPEYTPDSEGTADNEPKGFLAKLKARRQTDLLTPNSRWVKVPGIVRTYSTHNGQVCLEYTFESKSTLFTKSRLYVGLYPKSRLPSNQQDTYKTPFPCQVAYEPSNPRICVIQSINV